MCPEARLARILTPLPHTTLRGRAFALAAATRPVGTPRALEPLQGLEGYDGRVYRSAGHTAHASSGSGSSSRVSE